MQTNNNQFTNINNNQNTFSSLNDNHIFELFNPISKAVNDENEEKQENSEKEEIEEKEDTEEKNINIENLIQDDCFNPEKILNLFLNNEEFKNVKEFYDKNCIDEETQNLMKGTLISKKRKRRTSSELEKERIEKENNKKIIKRGRKPKSEISDENNFEKNNHNKYRPDNIMKKIKGNLFDFIIKKINDSLTDKSEQYSLKKIDYEYINQLKRDVDIRYLNMPIKELFSNKISSKYKLDASVNERNIIKILEIEKDNAEINYIFNLTFREWIDIFTLKKHSVIKIDGIDQFLEKILKNNNEKRYFSLFVYCLYNYERWFLCRKGRNTKSNN